MQQLKKGISQQFLNDRMNTMEPGRSLKPMAQERDGDHRFIRTFASFCRYGVIFALYFC